MTAPQEWQATPGTPERLGATADDRGVNFALFSAHAEKVELCLFSADGQETARIPLPHRAGDIWHAHIAGIKPGQVYGYRVYGPDDPAAGHRFNPNKLMLDPYAKDISGDIHWGTGHDDPATDNAADMVKARVASPLPRPQAPRPKTPWADTLIYEMHVRGYSIGNQNIPPHKRGTWEGVSDDASIAHLKSLGVTAVELLPPTAKVNDRDLAAKGLKNYWGYNTLNFFTPEPSYARHDTRAEFRAMVEKLHENGIEVILDLVFNHTGELDATNPALSLRGIDNSSYYKLGPGGEYINETGCGNTLDFTKPAVQRLVLDSLRHWATVYGVDGFRFDLAPVLGRGPDGFDAAAPLFKAIAADPVLRDLKMIAEPWDCGPDSYQLGNFPLGWHEWNDKFRDDVRRFWRGDANSAPALAARLAGSASEFDKAGRSPFESINFITCHDGFTLHDLVSYDAKHNEANGDDNRDGSDSNHSHNHGHEGPTGDDTIRALRAQKKRSMLATVFLAQGTPMLLAGDETGNSQNGNNNAYCQDNETGWLDWKDEDQDLTAFTVRLAELRRDNPALRAPHFLHGQNKDVDGVPDISWIAPSGKEMRDTDWHAGGGCFGMLLSNGAVAPEGKNRNRLLAVFNNSAKPKIFNLPHLPGGGWQQDLDTAAPEAKPHATASTIKVAPFSVAVFTQGNTPTR